MTSLLVMIEGAYKTTSPKTGQEGLKLDAVETELIVHFTAVLCGNLSLQHNCNTIFFTLM